MSSDEGPNSQIITEYADLLLKNVKVVLHEDVVVYQDEEPLTRLLAERLTEQGWPSKGGHVRYPIGNRERTS
jgi:hypothetical protein